MKTLICQAINFRRSFAVAVADRGDTGSVLLMRVGFEEWVQITRFHSQQSADEFAKYLNPPAIRKE